jgi:hypothetical protein
VEHISHRIPECPTGRWYLVLALFHPRGSVSQHWLQKEELKAMLNRELLM